MSNSESGATLQPDILHLPLKSRGTEPFWFLQVALASSMATIEIQASPCGPWQGLGASLPPSAGHSGRPLVSDSIYISKSQLVTQWMGASFGRDAERRLWKKRKFFCLKHTLKDTAQKRVTGWLHAPSLPIQLNRSDFTFIRHRCWKQAFYTCEHKGSFCRELDGSGTLCRRQWKGHDDFFHRESLHHRIKDMAMVDWTSAIFQRKKALRTLDTEDMEALLVKGNLVSFRDAYATE